jgi:hypothetical protein
MDWNTSELISHRNENEFAPAFVLSGANGMNHFMEIAM